MPLKGTLKYVCLKTRLANLGIFVHDDEDWAYPLANVDAAAL